MTSCKVIVRDAERRDCESIVGLIHELAVYENMRDQSKLTPEDLIRDGFDSDPPQFQCLVAEIPKNDANVQLDNYCKSDWTVVGYCLYFNKYSTWVGNGIHLEDFYVTPTSRRQGIGRKLLQQLAKIAIERGYKRIGLECLDWNTASLDYYKKLNAVDLTIKDGWHSLRFEGDSIKKLAEEP